MKKFLTLTLLLASIAQCSAAAAAQAPAFVNIEFKDQRINITTNYVQKFDFITAQLHFDDKAAKKEQFKIDFKKYDDLFDHNDFQSLVTYAAANPFDRAPFLQTLTDNQIEKLANTADFLAFNDNDADGYKNAAYLATYVNSLPLECSDGTIVLATPEVARKFNVLKEILRTRKYERYKAVPIQAPEEAFDTLVNYTRQEPAQRYAFFKTLDSEMLEKIQQLARSLGLTDENNCATNLLRAFATFECNDGAILSVHAALYNCWGTIQNIIEFGMEYLPLEEAPLFLAHCSSETFVHLEEYMLRQTEQEQQQFLQTLTLNEKRKLALAADYLNLNDVDNQMTNLLPFLQQQGFADFFIDALND